ncbi:MAG: hypothetical protein GWP10_13440 [Nitrospiraceae bacterium]|nr:hypothetical protein [Nitrospiraceae bacterium]
MFRILNNIDSNTVGLYKNAKLLKRKILYKVTDVLINTSGKDISNIALKNGILENSLAEILFRYINKNSIPKTSVQLLCTQAADIVYIVLSTLKSCIRLNYTNSNIMCSDEFISCAGIEKKVLILMKKSKEGEI